MRSVAFASLLALAACGDNQSPAVDPGPDAPVEDPCAPIELGTARLQFNLFNQLTGVSYPITSGDLAGSMLVIELYDSTTEGLPPLATGSFDLATAPNDNIATCQHCVQIARPLPEGTFDIQFYASEGALQLSTVEDPLGLVFAGSLTARLGEVELTEAGVRFVPGGACRRIEALAFDTTPRDATCTTLTDCPNELLQVCDPNKQRCVAPQCSIETGGCDDDQACVPQVPTEFHGACYDRCDPSVPDSCGEVRTCWQTGPQPNLGLCLVEGPGALGSACERQDASSGCAGELVCSEVSDTCTASCFLFDDDGQPGCDASTRCTLFGRCDPPDAGDPAAIGEACAIDAQLAEPCGVDALGYQGYCFAFLTSQPLACIEACLDDGDCAPEQVCAPRFTSGLGECIPDPVCGDGFVGELGEVCDDGNTSDGDRCSADCQTVDYTATCAAAEPITAGTTVTGDTLTALDGLQVSCQGGRARTELYTFSPATPGRLTITVDPTTTLSAALLTSCGETPVERSCDIVSPGFAAPIVAQLTTAEPITFSVAGFNSIEEGPFSFDVEFVPELCGDGIVAGNEICDDSNTTSNDGCRGDCRQIEYDAVCANAIPLSTATPNVGDTTTAPFLFENSCSAPVTGRDRVYTFTAPAAGTLNLSLDQGNNDLALVVFRGCGEPATMTELACQSVSGPEVADVTLAAGEQVTIVVDGFLSTSAGPYTLTAAFQ